MKCVTCRQQFQIYWVGSCIHTSRSPVQATMIKPKPLLAPGNWIVLHAELLQYWRRIVFRLDQKEHGVAIRLTAWVSLSYSLDSPYICKLKSLKTLEQLIFLHLLFSYIPFHFIFESVVQFLLSLSIYVTHHLFITIFCPLIVLWLQYFTRQNKKIRLWLINTY